MKKTNNSLIRREHGVRKAGGIADDAALYAIIQRTVFAVEYRISLAHLYAFKALVNPRL